MSAVGREFWDNISKPCPLPEGTRIRLIAMPDDPCPVPAGTLGTVRGGNGSQLWMQWDDGRTLNIAIGHDSYEVVEEPT